MEEKIEKTCENCEYENEDMEGAHCRHCIHNAEEHFEPKINHEKEIRNKAIDDFAEKLYNKSTNLKNIESDDYGMLHFEDVYEVAEQMKGGAE